MPPSSTTVSINTYTRLVMALKKEIEGGLLKIQRFAETQKVTTYWTIGKMISKALKANLSFTNEELYDRLVQDLRINKRTLQQCVQLFRVYPKINFKIPLSWSHYRYLITIEEDNERKRWEERLLKEHISASEFFLKLKEKRGLAVLAQPASNEKNFERGSLYTYRIIKANYVQDNPAGFMVDCGFDICIVPPSAKAKIDNTLIVESIKDAGQYFLVVSKKVKADIYTYKAMVERVVDGDTFLVNVDVGFGIWCRQYLRLRGLNAPELRTIKGDQTKRFIEKELSKCPCIIVKTYKSDKYDRYLVDVFYLPQESNPQTIAQEGMLLNSILVSSGLAEVWG